MPLAVIPKYRNTAPNTASAHLCQFQTELFRELLKYEKESHFEWKMLSPILNRQKSDLYFSKLLLGLKFYNFMEWNLVLIMDSTECLFCLGKKPSSNPVASNRQTHRHTHQHSSAHTHTYTPSPTRTHTHAHRHHMAQRLLLFVKGGWEIFCIGIFGGIQWINIQNDLFHKLCTFF